ncbi:senecionine N-oxygenase-like isoform X1 [Ostrinia nubilalis]|uniref:senecionine N-oxygenase-like isoform X1 n=2 Tax=Ostrinia nubilalis TaxID=29057 RepID=UPI0030825E6A
MLKICFKMKYVLILCVLFQLSFILMVTSSPRVCVIGAGVGGLSTVRYLIKENIKFTALESTKYVGGTWRYDERVGQDEYGQPIHTSMYRHLRTNLPKVIMELHDFPMPKDTPSYPPWENYYNYLKSYAEHFDLYKHIKFQHHVTSVKKIDDIWRVKYKHIPTENEFEEEFEYVVVAAGHHSKPHRPIFPGEDLFKGTIIHSHDYRVPDPYTCRRVLIVGSGPSGMDISLDVAYVSKTLVHSHHSKIDFRTPFPKNYIKKPDIKEFNGTGVIFTDGTYEDIDDVIYCTGYEYHYPFLDESSGLNISAHSVVPLYRYLVNINQPTMLIMGLVVRACLVVALDAQARYATALIKGDFTLPPQEVMMRDWQRQYDVIRSTGRPLSHIHLLAYKEDEYYAALTEESGIERVPPVFYKIRTMNMQSMLENLYTYRNYAYKILDRDTYEKILLEHEDSPKNIDCTSTS